MVWKSIDISFIVAHSALILFNLFGWLFPRTCRLNLITLVLTGLSWTVLGLFFGIGYCPLTDWHWRVLDQLGEPSRHTSYIQYLLERMLGVAVSSSTADNLTLTLYLVSLVCSVGANFFTGKKKAAGPDTSG